MQSPVAITGPDGAPFELAMHPQETVLPLAWLAHATGGPVRCPAAGGLVEILDGPTMLFELTDIGLQAVALASAQPVWVLTCDPRLTGLPLPVARRHRCRPHRRPPVGAANVADRSSPCRAQQPA
jgi:hypothetical protein